MSARTSAASGGRRLHAETKVMATRRTMPARIGAMYPPAGYSLADERPMTRAKESSSEQT